MTSKEVLRFRSGVEVDIDSLIYSAQHERNEGVCVRCGNWQGGCEPDARKYICEDCGQPSVYGCEEIILRNSL